jgi:steroid delta-isomerase-like uncharacterized protein
MTYTCFELSNKIFAAWNEKKPDDLLPLFDENFIDHTAPPEAPPGLDWVKMQYEIFTTAFPDIHIEIDDVVDAGDKVGERLTITGTHQGELLGVPATGKVINVSALAIHKAAAGRCTEVWFYLDEMAMMQQLGVIPSQA